MSFLSQSDSGRQRWNTACIFEGMEQRNLTAIAAPLPNSGPVVRRRVSRQPATPQLVTPWTVQLELSIRAEIRRLFHALTAPEYIETWISIPGHQANCANVATKDQNDFVIAHLCDGVTTTRISGCLTVCERRNLAFSWRVDGDRHVGSSFVDIRLTGNFEYTTLHLKHDGFASREHYGWHRSLWSLSLGKLKRLYDAAPLNVA